MSEEKKLIERAATERLYKTIRKHSPINAEELRAQESFLSHMDAQKALGRSIWARGNDHVHMCASAWMVNLERTKSLLVYHKRFKVWTYLGGHSDDEYNLARQAGAEVMEESGLTKGVRLVSPKPFSIEVLPSLLHEKNGEWVSPHIHLSVTFLFEADDQLPLKPQKNESKKIKWVPNNQVLKLTRDDMRPVVRRMLEKTQILHAHNFDQLVSRSDESLAQAKRRIAEMVKNDPSLVRNVSLDVKPGQMDLDYLYSKNITPWNHKWTWARKKAVVEKWIQRM